MKISHGLVSIATALAASFVTGSSAAAADCLQIDANSPVTACAGQAATLTASITNSCPSAERVTVGLVMDGKAMPVQARIRVNGDATLSKQVTVLIPAVIAPGSHTLTVTATDASGDATSTDVDVTVGACTAR